MSAQIEFIRATTNTAFNYNASAGSITPTSITVNPRLMHRRIYADVRHPNSQDRVVTFTLDFRLNGASVGSLQQKVGDSNTGLGLADWWGLTGSFGVSTPQLYRYVPNSLLTCYPSAANGEYMREVAPLDVTLEIDTITLTVNALTPGPANTGQWRVVLAALNSFHRFG